MNLGRSARKQVDVLSTICLEKVKNTMKILSKERRWKVEMRTGELPNGKHCWMATRRYYLKIVVKKKSNQSLLLQAKSGEEFSNVHFQLPSTELALFSGTEICHRAVSLPTTL
jgi:hypothetical protein